MSEFIEALWENPFLQRALLTGILAGVACGVIGTYVVVRRITYIAGGIAHCVLGGLGVAYYLNRVHGYDFIHPLHGAVVAALLAAVIIGLVSLRAKEREDTIISAIWAIGMAVGLIFTRLTPGYDQELMSYLFGNILMVKTSDLALLAGLDVLIVAVGILFYNQLQAVCFDSEFSRLRGLRVEAYYLLLLCLTALTVVLLVTVVGIVLVIALLAIPVAVAGYFSRTLWQMMVLAAAFSIAFTTGGLALSHGPDLPAGPTIIVVAGGVYLVVAVGARFFRKEPA